MFNENRPLAEDNEDFIEAILGNQIIVHQNDMFWYDVNPISVETVKDIRKRKNIRQHCSTL